MILITGATGNVGSAPIVSEAGLSNKVNGRHCRPDRSPPGSTKSRERRA